MKLMFIMILSMFSGILGNYLICKTVDKNYKFVLMALLNVLNAAAFLLMYFKFGFTIAFIKYSLLLSLLIMMSFIDYYFKEVYFNTVCIGVILSLIFIAVNMFCFNIDPKQFIIAGISGYLIIWLIHLITHGHGIGLGDAEVFLIVGLFTGCHVFVIVFLLTFIIAFIFSIPKVIKCKSNFYVPLVPYITISTALAVFFI